MKITPISNINEVKAMAEIESLTFTDGCYTYDQLVYEYKDNPFAKTLLAYNDNELVGFLIYMITFNSATIIQIAVHPKFQRQRIGSALLKEMETILKSKGYGEIESVTLEVRKKNKPAYNLYAKHGYQDVCVKPKYYANGDDAIYMMKVLL